MDQMQKIPENAKGEVNLQVQPDTLLPVVIDRYQGADCKDRVRMNLS